MCGIFGIVGFEPVAPRLVAAAERLQSRGEHSTGVATFDGRLFERNQRVLDYHAIVYQMGNSPAHLFVHDIMMRHGGVVAICNSQVRLWANRPASR